MAIKYYPFLLCLEESIEYIDNQETLEHAVFHLTAQQKQFAICLQKDGQCHNLSGKALPSIPLEKLTKLVQQALVDDGQCCVQKVILRRHEQAFELLSQLHN
ncbi:hypothetical protein PA25_06590 [Pseudoalteromonas sp. A25]|uniref:hypothetical protein n=1 Tax=Pseudoalteromonas sp. A25 TaxID=116092 RepID=UPI001260DDCA|nr:hypothetical protein [Pseudoalteromonas sp. A25]BBN80674.1 hypothetical protein PA25_06590 [Pseudoalteromonas sp. A25]